MAAPTKHALSEDRLAAMAGVSDTTWKAHKAQGCPVPRTARDLPGWLPKYHAWRRANGKQPNAPATPPLDPETQRHKRDHAKWRAVLTQIHVGEKTRALIPRKEVVDYCARAALQCRIMLDGVVARIAALVSDADREYIRAELRREVDVVCAAFESGNEQALVDSATASEGTGDPSSVEDAEAPDGERMG